MGSERKLVLFIATSLDGYIARENGSLDWLYAVEGEGDNGFTEFYNTIDTLVMGKATYDHLMTLVEEFPHSDKTCYIFSRSEQREDKHVTFINEDISEFTRRLMAQSGSNIWLVGGGDLLDTFVKEKLVDEFIVTISPIILGKGVPLFKQDNPEIELELIEQRRFGQFVQLHYLTKK
ncbi:dihydrofolate reductase family protein [Bacillus sp. 165]|uniref:dihydrofolate reductase family protein n=1 Tax=Bacillus sp. 165 TaxID=1529117 RepID=UPI001ADA9965|nr:dihydrofolate reductase family protein [Bacillus sp. 165]MBO9128999.1 dihydrofolate reductase [Bacillus sp. 165]